MLNINLGVIGVWTETSSINVVPKTDKKRELNLDNFLFETSVMAIEITIL
jgi:hypothetical protein